MDEPLAEAVDAADPILVFILSFAVASAASTPALKLPPVTDGGAGVDCTVGRMAL